MRKDLENKINLFQNAFNANKNLGENNNFEENKQNPINFQKLE